MDDSYINRIEELIENSDIELKGLIKILIDERNALLKLVNHDELTKINNRRILNDSINYDIVVMCDIDNFKEVNDKFGHTLGDKVLVLISKMLDSVTRGDDFVCRYGGDEFALVLNKCSIDDAIRKLEFIKNKVVRVMNELDLNITVSFGLTEYESGKALTAAIKEADQALYYSKRSGKNMITAFKENKNLVIKK